MDAHRLIQRIVTILIIVTGMYGNIVFAGPVRIYGGEFDLPLNDPTGTGSALTEAAIVIPDHFIIADLNVKISITHTHVFDLQLILQGPEGTRVCLNMYEFNEIFEGENYTDTIFDDEAELPIKDAIAPFTGSFRPEAGNLLGIYDSRDAYGTWVVQIYDMWPADTGTLDEAELTFTETPEPTCALMMTFGATILTLHRKKRLVSAKARSVVGSTKP